MLKLIIDSREQLPLKFRQGVFDEIVVEGRPVGDYWGELNGTEIPFCYERKSLADLFSTMTQGYDHWKRMIEKSDKLGMKVILLIEGTLRDIHAGVKYSEYSGESMLKKLAMLSVRHNLEWHCFEDRRSMTRYIEEMFDAVRRNYKHEIP